MKVFTRRAVLAFSAVMVFSVPVWAQRATIRRVSIVTVKPDRTSDFEAAVKQYNEIYAKIPGAGGRGLFQSMTGPHQFMLVRDYDKWGDLDSGPVEKAVRANAELSRLNSHIVACFESGSTLIEELLPELSMPRPSGPPTLIRLARSRIRADKTAEFESIVKDELLPAYKKAGEPSLTVRRARFGAPNNEYYMSSRMSGWADVGKESLRKSMGEEAYKKMVSKLTALTVERELNVYRFRQDLSYTPSAATLTTTK
jgi:hypothetical protein